MVSIIIPAYNVEKYIEKSLLSAMNQTLEDIEIIVINDGSTDNTKNIIKKLMKEDSRIKLIDKENGGLSSARNAGIMEAKGEYIQHLDGDDWLEKEACNELYKMAKENKLDLILCDFYKENLKNKKIKIKSFNLDNNILLGSENCFRELRKNNFNVAVCSKFIKRELYIKNNIIHLEGISLGEDLATIPKLIICANRIMKNNKAYYHYMYNSSSLTNSNFSNKIGELFLCFEDLENYFKDKNINREELEILKANHLANFFYNKPLNNSIKYKEELKKFTKYASKLDKDIICKLKIEKKISYKYFKNIKSEYLQFKYINLLSKIKYMINRLKEL